MAFLSLAVFSAIFAILAGLFYKYQRKQMSRFKMLNIPGPEPHWLFGNIKELQNLGTYKANMEWAKKYGKIFGYFLGARPILVIGDLELLRQVQIKDFQNFANRPVIIPGGINVGKESNSHMILARDMAWKNQRAVLTPSFTTSKMKQMVPLVQNALDELLSHIENHAKTGNDFDIYEMYKALTLDVIGRTAFGIKSDCQKSRNDPFVHAAQSFLRDAEFFSGFSLLGVLVPKLYSIVIPLRHLSQMWRNWTGASKLQELFVLCKSIVKTRRANPKSRRNDLLQMMLDAEMSHVDINRISSDDLIAGHESETKGGPEILCSDSTDKKKTFHMTDDEVVSNSLLVLIAGYETTSTALAFTTHILVNRLDIQEKVRKEVQQVFASDGILDYTNVLRCKYLDQVLMESLRYHPPVSGFISRDTAAEIKYGDMVIPKDFTVQISMAVHRDPDYWTDPDVIDPDRFSPENKRNFHPLAFQSFGAGPRNCIGMRFAQMEAKLAIANLLLKYRLVPGERTVMGEPDVAFKLGLTYPKEVYVKVEKI